MTTRPDSSDRLAAIAARLRAAGCVFAEEEAAVLLADGVDAGELEARIRRREAGEPLEHVVGWVRFGSLRLSVGPGVFVPRQRTLRLARAAVRVAREQQRPVVFEPYCGVAPVAASVAAARPDAELHVADIDPQALEHARRNLPASASVYLGDRMAGVPDSLRGRVSLVASVPPYVPTAARGLVPREALEHEPGAALFAGHDGLDHVRALVAALPGWLAPDGVVLLELNRMQYRLAADAARQSGWRASPRHGADGQTTTLVLRPT